MNRTKLTENLSHLNETEIDILTYLTQEPIDWFNNLSIKDSRIESLLKNAFQYYTDDNPIKKIYYKVIEGIYNTDNILFDDINLHHRSETFQNLANQINKLYEGPKQKYILIILKALVERDFTDFSKIEINSKDFNMFLHDSRSMDIEDLIYNLSEKDLQAILMFCEVN